MSNSIVDLRKMLSIAVTGETARVRYKSNWMDVDAYALWSSIGLAGWGCFPARVQAAGGLRLRLSPHVTNNIEAILPDGSELALPTVTTITSDGKRWYRVNSEYGPGYCMADYVHVLGLTEADIFPLKP